MDESRSDMTEEEYLMDLYMAKREGECCLKKYNTLEIVG